MGTAGFKTDSKGRADISLVIQRRELEVSSLKGGSGTPTFRATPLLMARGSGYGKAGFALGQYYPKGTHSQLLPSKAAHGSHPHTPAAHSPEEKDQTWLHALPFKLCVCSFVYLFVHSFWHWEWNPGIHLS